MGSELVSRTGRWPLRTQRTLRTEDLFPARPLQHLIISRLGSPSMVGIKRWPMSQPSLAPRCTVNG